MFEPKYKILKETPEFKKGTILELRGCYSNGDYDYVCNDMENAKFDTSNESSYPKEVVEKQPEWFEKVSVLWLTGEELKKVNKFLGRK